MKNKLTFFSSLLCLIYEKNKKCDTIILQQHLNEGNILTISVDINGLSDIKL